jgi:hypothetical protein
MKKLLLIAFLLASIISFGQPTNYTKVEHRYNWLAGYFRALNMPTGTTAAFQTGQSREAGAQFYDSTGADSGYYVSGVNQVFHRMAWAREIFYRGDGTFTSNRTVSGGGFSLAFNNLSSFSLNSIRDAVVRSDLNVLTDSIVFQPHAGKINIDSLRSEHGSDTTTYKVAVWSPTNKSLRYLTYWPGGGGASDHGGLTGLSDDDHTQYALLLGRSGGQYLIGGTAANDDLTLEGTSNATRTSSYVIIQPTAGNVGIGASTPEARLTVRGTAGLPSAIVLQNTTDNVDFAFYPASIGVVYGILSGKDHVFATYGSPTGLSGFTELGRFNTAGEFIVGTTDNGAFNLQVNGGSYFSAQTQHELQLKIKDIAAPSTPASGYGVNYVNTDKPWFKDDGGNAFEYSLFAVSTTASSATPTPTGHARSNDFDVTALATNPTFAAPSGTPINGNMLTIRIKDDGTPRTLAFNAIYRAGAIPLPTTTIANKTMFIGFKYNSASSTWDLIASVDNL